MLPFISFLIPVRDDAARLRRCLTTIRHNGYPDDRYEIIVVDNGSTDQSATVAATMGATVLSAPGLRVTELRNRAASIAKGEVLACIDADHELPEHWAEYAVETLQHPGVGAVGSACQAPPDGTWVQRMYDAFRTRPSGCHDTEWLPGGNMAVWRTAFDRCGQFDRTLHTCEDVEFCQRLRRHGLRVVSDARLCSVHLGDPATLRSLFLGELWRGRDNWRATWRGPVAWRGLPSVVIPTANLGFIMAAVLAPTADVGLRTLGVIALPLGGWAVTMLALSVILGFSMLRVGRMMANMETATPWAFGQALTVASVYDIARALAPVSRATHQIRRASERPFRRPIRVLELRSVFGTGGGPEKTILLGAAAATDPDNLRVTVCYIRDRRDEAFGIDARAAKLGVDYVEIGERHSFDPAIWPALRKLVRERQIDIVHAHDYKTNVIALMLGRVEGAIPLTTVHGWTGHSWKEKRLYYPVDKRVIARFPRVIAVSEEIRQELLRRGAQPHVVSTVLNGIDHRAYRRDPSRVESIRRMLGVDHDQLIVGGVGRLEPQKRFDVLLEAFAAARRIRPTLRLFIVGEGGERRSLQQLAERLGLGGACQFLGHREDVADVHHALDLFVQSSDYEGTPNAVLEAMALETPIIATDVGGTSELIDDGVHGVVIRPSDPEVLTEAIDWVFGNPKATKRRTVAARARVEGELSFEARMDAVVRIYEDLIRRSTTSTEQEAVRASQWKEVRE